jgi:hypothetical protein
MSTMTYDAAARAHAEASAKPRRKGWRGALARAFARVVEARQRQALAELRRYGIVLPRELDQAGWKASERSEDSLPFKR